MGLLYEAMLLMIDNYDSFTFNLVHFLGELGAQTHVVRNDAISVEDALSLKPEAIVISPGPCEPDQAGICLELITKASEEFPILGVCLGHQAIGQAFGAKVVRAPIPVHGKMAHIHHNNESVFEDLPQDFEATRYHSLVVDRNNLPDTLKITAQTDDGLIMGLEHRDLNIHGVQFHPESIASQHGHALLKNFLMTAGVIKT